MSTYDERISEVKANIQQALDDLIIITRGCWGWEDLTDERQRSLKNAVRCLLEISIEIG